MSFNLEQCIYSDKRIHRSKWKHFEENYLDTYDFDINDWNRESWKSAFRKLNWLRLLPKDTIPRIQFCSNLDSVLHKIIQETADNLIESEISLSSLFSPSNSENSIVDNLSTSGKRAGIEITLCKFISGTFRGDIDFDRIDLADSEFSPGGFEYEDKLSVPIKIINKNNFVNYVIYSFDDAQNVFGSAYGNPDWMIKRIVEQGTKPEVVIENALRVNTFTEENTVWNESAPPQHPITFVNMNASTLEFWRVNDPQKVYNDTWGNANKMKLYDPNTITSDQSFEHIHDADAANWHIHLGI